jgi:uracil-DNA glycosylase family 4
MTSRPAPDNGGTPPRLPHPGTGRPFPSPVPPGTGWPDDPADAATPVAADAASVERLADPEVGLAELSARVSVCRACPRLVGWREQVAVEKRRSFAGEPYWGRPSTGFGDPQPGVLVVGLAPAANGANRTGRVFTGDRSGEWLFAALHDAGLATRGESRHAGDGLTLPGARIVPAVRCAPPANAPSPAERDACAPWLRAEAALVWPTVGSVVALGRFAWDAVLRLVRDSGGTVPRPVPRFGHAAESVLGRPGGGSVVLVGSFHPSQQNTFTGRLTMPMLTAVLLRAAELAAPDPARAEVAGPAPGTVPDSGPPADPVDRGGT